jgi:regulator of sigma E protease
MINIIIITLSFIGGLVAKLFGGGDGVSVESVSGPVGIFSFLKQTLSLGVAYVLRYAALISIAVGIFNALPFPALDGGRATLIFYEAVFGKKLINPRTEAWLHAAGFFLLIGLIVVITYFDIQKL